jgi:hypothetical protein
VLVRAIAGSGKSMMLQAIGKKYDDRKVVYLTYNHAVCSAQAQKYKAANLNTTLHTFHEFALKRTEHVHAGRFTSGNYRVCPEHLGDASNDVVACVQTTLDNFVVSAARCVSTEHVPSPQPRSSNGKTITAAEIVVAASNIWAWCIDPDVPMVPSLHMLFKLFELEYADKVSPA